MVPHWMLLNYTGIIQFRGLVRPSGHYVKPYVMLVVIISRRHRSLLTDVPPTEVNQQEIE